MFHLYFGAFDIVMYLGGMYVAVLLANAICDQLDEADVKQETALTTPAKTTAIQSLPTRGAAPAVKKREEVSVRVSVNS